MKLFKQIIFRLYVIMLMIFTVWYGHFVYPIIFGFDGKESAGESLEKIGKKGTEEEQLFLKLLAEKSQSKKTDLGYKVIEQPYIEGRFHHIGFEIAEDKTSLCIRCHGNIPHDKSVQVRSFLNMHTFFLACETCHVAQEHAQTIHSYNWYDKENGNMTGNPLALKEILDSESTINEIANFGSYGNYGAKIAPTIKQAGTEKFLISDIDNAYVDRFLQNQERLNHEEKSQAKRIIHRKVQLEPVKCKSCHQLDSQYLPFDQLGYSPSRIKELTNSEVLLMIDKITVDYHQTAINPGRDSR